MNKFVIFDMDGLMFDTERVFVKAWDYAGEKIGIGKAGYMTLRTLGMSIVMSRKIWIEEFGDKYNEDELRRHTKEFFKIYYAKNRVPVKKGLYVLLGFLKEHSYRMAVASSSPRWEVETHLKDAGIFNDFEVVISGDMVNKSKPEPDIYLKACDLLGADTADVYALEDSRNGLLSAYNAGCKPIMVPDLWQPDEEIVKILFAKYDDLEQVKVYFENIESFNLTD